MPDIHVRSLVSYDKTRKFLVLQRSAPGCFCNACCQWSGRWCLRQTVVSLAWCNPKGTAKYHRAIDVVPEMHSQAAGGRRRAGNSAAGGDGRTYWPCRTTACIVRWLVLLASPAAWMLGQHPTDAMQRPSTVHTGVWFWCRRPAAGVPAEPLPSVQRRICLLVSASWRQFSPSHPRHTRAFCRSTSQETTQGSPPNPRHAPQNGLLPARALRPLPVRRGLRILRVRLAAGPGGRAASSGSGCVWGVVEKGRSPHPSRHPPCSPTPRRSGDTHGFCSVCYKAQQSTALAAATAPSPSPAPAAAAAAEPAPAPAAEPMLVEPAPAPVQEEAAASPAAAAADASEAGDEKPVQVRFGRGSKQLRLCRVRWSTFLGAHSRQRGLGVPPRWHAGSNPVLPLIVRRPPASLACPPARLQENRGRCFCCRKKVGLLGFECR